MANITIDGKPYTVPDGITIIEAIDRIQTDLPRYCYHPGLSIAGNCRICQVEVEKMPRTVIACNTKVAEGMVIHTKSPKAKESQQVVLEFLLANHPLDCPVCDQAGECKLQDYYMDYGLYDSKLDDLKVKKTKKAVAVGPTIMLDQERCILCSRCVRFGDEITKTNDFGIFNRGDHSELDIYPGRELNNKYSGNVADICPVGALTDRDFRFKMRVWYLGKQESVCPGCSRGCNTSIEFEKSRPYKSSKGRVMRLKPRENEHVNRWWMCDEGRYAYKAIDTDRIESVLQGRQPSAWKTALESLSSLLQKANSSRWAVLVSPQLTNEDAFAVKRVLGAHFKMNQFYSFAPGQEGYQDEFLIRADKNPNTAGVFQIFGQDEKSGSLALAVEKAKKGELDGMIIFGFDLAKIFGAETFKIVREKVATLIVEGSNQSATAAVADWVLPGACYAEKDGSFTNFQGRVQRIRKALEPIGDSKPTYGWLAELAALSGLKLPYYRAELVFADLASSNEAFKGMEFKKLGKQGLLWNTVRGDVPSPPKGLPGVTAGAARV